MTRSHFVSPTTIGHSLHTIFRFSSDSAFARMPLGLIHDTSSLRQEWLGAIIQQAITSGYTQIYPDIYMPPHGGTLQDELFSNAWPQSANIFEAEIKWCHPFADDMMKYIFLKDIYYSIKISLTLHPGNDHFQHWFRWWLCADQATSHHLNQWWPGLVPCSIGHSTSMG